MSLRAGCIELGSMRYLDRHSPAHRDLIPHPGRSPIIPIPRGVLFELLLGLDRSHVDQRGAGHVYIFRMRLPVRDPKTMKETEEPHCER